ncbi:Protein of unknown function [Rhodoferax sp. OV413]|uniref:DUF1302 domain-containing protein n=1 Tax=Rhodoferax sp. OV413 TaxID=1855285 RepID=UPI000890C3B6|nr:DUF1302 domain-containing protein [Rhodoferax sp. OV413]SDP36039.1 Protein of unknown function [Rhodoferax sp. OV413]
MIKKTNPFQRSALALAAGMLCALSAQAFELDSGNPDTKIRLDFTPKFSTAYRMKDASPGLISPATDGGVVNENDGDTNFRKKGIVSTRMDLLTEFDVTHGNYGLRISHSAWYDSKYLGHSNNDGSNGVNNFASQPSNEFLPFTRSQHGRNDEFLDAFVFAKGNLGEMPASIRVGKHALQYGESLFFGQNGIANAQGPVDIAKISSVPNWQFKEVLLPVEQISGTLQLTDGVTLGGYYQLKWRPSKLPGVGSYFSNQDYINGGRVYLGPGTVLNTDNSKDQTPGNSGQFGAQLRWSPAGSAFEYGFYAARYNEKTPAVPVFDLINGNVHKVYAEGIKTVGASVTSSVGPLNWALEGSLRADAPLAGDPAVLLPAFLGVGGPAADCSGSPSNPCFAIGKTAHINLSGIYVLTKGPLWDGGSIVSELAWNRTLSVTKNPSTRGNGGLDPNTTRDAAAFRMIFEPQYFQVLPGLDLSVPLGLGYNFAGRSSAIMNYAGGASKAGDYTVGVKAKYRDWNLGLSYTAFFGSQNTFTVVDPAGSRMLSYGQTMKDRNYLALNISRTF